MLKFIALLPFLALPALAQQAQQPDPGIVPPLTFKDPTLKYRVAAPTPHVTSNGCPVGILAQPRQGTPQSVWVSSVEDVSQASKSAARTGVHVILSSVLAPMTHVTVSVRYRKFTQGAVLVSSQPRLFQEKVFELEASGGRFLERNLLVAGYAEVDRVRVLKVVYADGTKWETEAGVSCSARPSHFVLVATR